MLARDRVRLHLERLNKSGQPVSTLNYQEAVQRADWARSFIDHPYWAVLSRMLTGTIQNETEQMLTGDDHLALNRASVAMCRKILQAPFLDIEQGKLAESVYQRALAQQARKFGQQVKARDSAETIQ